MDGVSGVRYRSSFTSSTTTAVMSQQQTDKLIPGDCIIAQATNNKGAKI